MRPYWIAIIASAFVAPVSAFDFKGIEIGAVVSPDEIEQKLGTRCTGRVPTRCTASVVLANVRGFMMITRTADNVIEMITISFDSSQFMDVEAIALKKFGEPSNKASRSVQNRMGAVFENVEYTWADEKGDSVLLQKYASTIDKSYLTYTSKLALDRYIEAKKNQPADF